MELGLECSLFSAGFFLDALLKVVEQDISRYESMANAEGMAVVWPMPHVLSLRGIIVTRELGLYLCS